MSVSTFGSSINSINNSYNDNNLEDKMEIKIDLLGKDLRNMNLNDGMLENKEKNIVINEKREEMLNNNINIKKTSNNPNIARRISKLRIDY